MDSLQPPHYWAHPYSKLSYFEFHHLKIMIFHNDLSVFFFFFGSSGAWTQDFVLAR
jgi:hypothetical protein